MPSTFPCSRICATPSSHFWLWPILHHSWSGPLSRAPFPWAVLQPSQDDWLIIAMLWLGVSCHTVLAWLCLSYWWHSCGWLLPFAHCVSWPLSLLSVCLSILTDVCKWLFGYCWTQMAQPSYPSRMRLRTFLDAGFDSYRALERHHAWGWVVFLDVALLFELICLSPTYISWSCMIHPCPLLVRSHTA